VCLLYIFYPDNGHCQKNRLPHDLAVKRGLQNYVVLLTMDFSRGRTAPWVIT